MSGKSGALKRVRAERRGRLAEIWAALFLMAKGYRLLAHRARTPWGEVDLAAVKNGILVFVEVKARATPEAALAAVHPTQQARMARAAAALAGKWRLLDLRQRFDVVAVSRSFRLHHVRDAWRA